MFCSLRLSKGQPAAEEKLERWKLHGWMWKMKTRKGKILCNDQ